MDGKLAQMFTERDEQYQTATDELIKELYNATEAVLLFFRSITKSTAGTIVWDDVSLLTWEDGVVEDDDIFVMLAGSLSYNVGDVVALVSGETTTITEDTIDYFSKSVRFGIPFSMAVSASVDEILFYIEESARKLEETNDDESDSTDFDLDQLTDQQKQSLIYNTTTGRKN